MLPSHSLGLIVDTGVVLDILARHPARTLHDSMFEWAASVVGKIDPPPHGRSIIMFVSAGVYRDYKSRLSRAGVATPRSYWHSMRKIKLTRAISRPLRLLFTIQAVKTDGAEAARWQGDRFDRPFFALLAAAGRARAWSDRPIIFASRDRDASTHMRNMTVTLGYTDRVHFADGIASCEEMIEC